MQNRATFSPCRKYRYCLWRQWGDLLRSGPVRYVQFIGLNPSIADEVLDDPTIRVCVNYAKRWGMDALCMTNIFAWRDTDPAKMKAAAEPVGADNDYWIREIAEGAEIIIAAWGNHGTHLGRDREVLKLIPNERIKCLVVNKATGQPSHPLYKDKLLKPIPYVAR